MEKYLLFAFREYYPNGGMDDCIFVADNVDELNSYAMQYIEDNKYDFDYMHYYDCNSGKTYEAEFEEKEDGWGHSVKKFSGWNLREE